jgi:hypothetical protein
MEIYTSYLAKYQQVSTLGAYSRFSRLVCP